MKRLMFLGILSSLAIAVCCQKKIKLPDPSQHKNITKISTLRLNMPTAPGTFDPAKIFLISELYISQQIHRGLVQMDLAGQINPAIAERWDISEDLKTYTFYLRKNALFHHGRPVVASDFVFSFRRLLDPKIKAPMRYYVKTVKNVEAIDAHTLRIQLSHPYAPMIKIFASPLMSVIPKEIIEKPIGAGPFQVHSFDQKKKKITLLPFKNYFEGRSRLEKIECFILPDEAAYYKFLAGDLDYFKIGFASASDFIQKLSQKKIKIRRTLQHGITLLGFNHKTPPFDDKNFRKALSLCIDWKAYEKNVLELNHKVADQIFPRDLFGRIDTQAFERHNLAYAKKLLKKSKYKNFKKYSPLELTKSTLFKNEKEDLFFTNAFKQLGLDLKIRYLDQNAYRDTLIKITEKNNFQLLYYRGIPFISDPHMVSGFFHSGVSNNYFHYDNPTVDFLIDQGIRTHNFEQRKKIYEKISQILYDDVAVIPLYYWDHVQAIQPTLNFGEYNYVAVEDFYTITKK